jgi:hypothetical protein
MPGLREVELACVLIPLLDRSPSIDTASLLKKSDRLMVDFIIGTKCNEPW